MIRFKSFLVEYLTDKQKTRYKNVHMTDKARSDTDHFFGSGNDLVHGEISHDAGHHEHKGEIHQEIERHLGKEIHHDDYHQGISKDHLNRPVKLGKLIKDPKLRDKFASDNTRQGAKKGSVFKTSTVRGTEVAGQTNSKKDPQHPKGHSWGELSCKNVDNGENKHYLKHEIKHGTVLHRVHDHTGQEIYRATLHPHHNEHGHVVYDVNSEYGIKHPAFTKSSHEVASKLSGEHKPGVFTIHPKVYNDKGHEKVLHPNATKEHLDKDLDDKDASVRRAVMSHKNITSEHLHKALNDKHKDVRIAAAKHQKATSEHLHKALDDKDSFVRRAAAKHPKATSEHLHKALEDKDASVRSAAASNQNATSEHLHKALDDKNEFVRASVAEHPNATSEHLHKALDDKDSFVRTIAAKHPKATSEHLHKALDDKHKDVRIAGVSNRNSTKEHLDKALTDKHAHVRNAAITRHQEMNN
jgi:HEAT repeat protein